MEIENAISLLQSNIDENENILKVVESSTMVQTFQWENKAYRLAIEALEKQIAKKPIIMKNFVTRRCPVCNCEVETMDMELGHCEHCGQKIDWENEPH